MKKVKIKFDYSFLLDNDTLYCTEFINEVYFKLLMKICILILFDFFTELME